MGKMKKTALHKKKGALRKKKWRATEGRTEKNRPSKKKGRSKKKKMKGRALQKQDKKKGALHSNKPSLSWIEFWLNLLSCGLAWLGRSFLIFVWKSNMFMSFIESSRLLVFCLGEGFTHVLFRLKNGSLMDDLSYANYAVLIRLGLFLRFCE